MKSFFTILSVILFLFSVSYSQQISLEMGQGILASCTNGDLGIPINQDIILKIRLNNDTPNYIKGSTNGFRLYSPDGAIWSYTSITEEWPTGAITTSGPNGMYDGGIFVNEFSFDGSGSDTIGFGGFRLFQLGIPPGFDEVVFEIKLIVNANQWNKTIILDSCWYPPAGIWEWSLPEVYSPSWGGPYIFKIVMMPDCGVPTFTTLPSEFNMYPDNQFQFQFNADPVACDEIPVYCILEGPGEINNYSGLWQYTPTTEDIGLHQLIIKACQNTMGNCGYHTVNVNVKELCCELRGDIDNQGGTTPINISDLTYIVDYLFVQGPEPVCRFNADLNNDMEIMITDLTFLVDYLFGNGPAPVPCSSK